MKYKSERPRMSHMHPLPRLLLALLLLIALPATSASHGADATMSTTDGDLHIRSPLEGRVLLNGNDVIAMLRAISASLAAVEARVEDLNAQLLVRCSFAFILSVYYSWLSPMIFLLLSSFHCRLGFDPGQSASKRPCG